MESISKNDYLYLLAEFDNYKKSVSNRIELSEKNQRKNIFNQVIPILDDLERMEAFLNKKHLEQYHTLLWNFKKEMGLEMIIKNFHSLLEKHGIKKFNSIGEKATHNKHHVIKATENTGKEHGTIITVYKEGYTIDNDILRYAEVEVAI